MSEVSYYVAFPFVPSDDGIAAGEAVEVLQSECHRDEGGGFVA
ncbi:hypothetical protein ACVWW2_007382 [Bradyrhizobium sp. LM4.3]